MKNAKNTIRNSAILFVLIQFLFTLNVSSQLYLKRRAVKTSGFGIQISQSVSGTGHGSLTKFNITAKRKGSEILLGVNMPTKDFTNLGYNLSYKYHLLENKTVGCFLHVSAAFCNERQLSDKLNRYFHGSEYNGELELFRTFENYAGFGLQIRIIKQLFFNAKIGIGGHKSCIRNEDNRNEKFTHMRCETGAGLIYEFGLQIRITK